MNKQTRKTYIGAIDQGTSSSRFLIFDSQTAEVVVSHQIEITQIVPRTGWVEEDPEEILSTVKECINRAVDKLKAMNLDPADIKAVGVTNQQATSVVWDKSTGKPFNNAIVWLDTRTEEMVKSWIDKIPDKDRDHFRGKMGTPILSLLGASKIRWVLENVPEAKKAMEEDRCMAGPVDSWLIWNLTGGVNGGQFVTDPSNASCFMLMNIHSLQWDPELCSFFEVPREILPEIRSSSEIYGYLDSTELKGTPISADMGDTKADLVGKRCFKPGEARAVYGTGGGVGCNTGDKPVESKSMMTPVLYKLGKNRPPCYYLETIFYIAGAGVKWLVDNLGIIKTPAEIEELAATVDDTHGCYFVPAFSGLLLPEVDPNAKGIICGLSQFTNKAHIARAYLESVCFQTREIVEAVYNDSGIRLSSLMVGGGMTVNRLLMQLMADLLGIPIVRPAMTETTALGVALMAGSAEGIDLYNLETADFPEAKADTFVPVMSETERERAFAGWRNAVTRAMNWEN